MISADKLEEIRSIFDQAAGQWTGLDFTELMPPEGGNPISDAYDISRIEDFGDSATANEWLLALLKDCPMMDISVAHHRVAKALGAALEYKVKVEFDAEEAEACAEEAIEALENGNVEKAKELAKKAYDLESSYGDTPTWGEFYRAIRDLEI